MYKDPVCGMEITQQQAAGSSQYHGQKYYFCSADCREIFDHDPARYVGQQTEGKSGRQSA